MAVCVVKTINGVKQLVPVSGSTPLDSVQSGNMSPVTSNAVAEYTVDEVTSGNMHSVSSNAVARAIKPTYYQSTTGAVSVSGANVIRKITNLPSGLYYVTYGFGYVEARAGYQQFYTSDANGTTSTSVMQLRGGWENVEVSCIISMPNGGEIGFKGYNSSSNFAEQSNGKGITAIRLGDV